MFILTIDTDWAQDFIVEDTLSLLDKYSVKATIFCTHRMGIKFHKRHELGIHPNIRSIDECKGKINELMQIYPKAVGIRNHALFSSYYLYKIYQESGLKYESNYMMFMQPDIKPFFMAGGILQLPIYFMDDVYLRAMRAQRDNFHIRRFLKQNEKQVKVFAFHPIHIYMNTRNINDYQKFKTFTAKQDIERSRNTGYPGIRTMFKELLDFINSKGIKQYTLKDIARHSHVRD